MPKSGGENYVGNMEEQKRQGTLFKYKVVDFTVKSDALRYYDISAVYRNYIYGIDGCLRAYGG